jgi:hypothetical protein
MYQLEDYFSNGFWHLVQWTYTNKSKNEFVSYLFILQTEETLINLLHF